jgi:hypothetical protein
LSQKAILHNGRFAALSPFHKQLTEKQKMSAYANLLAAKRFQSFTMICRKPHMARSICFRATIFQNPEGTLWSHCIQNQGYFHHSGRVGLVDPVK